MKRNISKRFELNRKEADLLRIKSRQTGKSEDYMKSCVADQSLMKESPPGQQGWAW